MLYSFLEKLLTRDEFRKCNPLTDVEPSEAHVFNYDFTRVYIKNKKVLDVGCWGGQYEKLALHDVKEIVGVDPDNGAISYARRAIKGATFIQGSALDLPFKDHAFDAVTFIDVIEHVPKHTEAKCLREINRVLKPNGAIILSTCYKHPLAVLFDPAFWAFGHRHYSKKELSEFLKKSKFKTEKIFINGGYWGISIFIYSMFAKYIIRKKFEIPKYINQKIYREYRKDGFVGIYIVARKMK